MLGKGISGEEISAGSPGRSVIYRVGKRGREGRERGGALLGGDGGAAFRRRRRRRRRPEAAAVAAGRQHADM